MVNSSELSGTGSKVCADDFGPEPFLPGALGLLLVAVIIRLPY
jgi:hypothetical protein